MRKLIMITLIAVIIALWSGYNPHATIRAQDSLAPQAILNPPYGGILNGAWSADGQFAIATTTGIWLYGDINAPPRQLMPAISGFSIVAITFSPDNTHIAFNAIYQNRDDDDLNINRVSLLNIATGEVTLIGEHPWKYIARHPRITYSADGQFVYVGGDRLETLQRWNLVDQSIETFDPDERTSPRLLAFSPDHHQALIVTSAFQDGWQYELIVLDLLKNTQVASHKTMGTATNDFWRATFLPNGQILAAIDNENTEARDMTLSVWNTDTDTFIRLNIDYYKIKNLDVNANGTQVVLDVDSGRSDRGTVVWDLQTQTRRYSFMDEIIFEYNPNEVFHHPTQDIVIIANNRGLFYWNLGENPEPLYRLQHGTLATNISGDIIAYKTGSAVQIWNGEQQTTFAQATPNTLQMEISADSRFLLTVSADNNSPSDPRRILEIWNIQTGQQIVKRYFSTSSVTAYLTEDNRLLTYADGDLGVSAITDNGLETPTIYTLTPPEDLYPSHASFSDNGQILNIYLSDVQYRWSNQTNRIAIQQWNTSTGELIKTVENKVTYMDTSRTHSNFGKQFGEGFIFLAFAISDSSTGMIYDYSSFIWNIETNTFIGQPIYSVAAITCNPIVAGPFVVNGSQTHGAQFDYTSVWAVNTQTDETVTLEGLEGCPSGAFSPDHTLAGIISYTVDRTYMLWVFDTSTWQTVTTVESNVVFRQVVFSGDNQTVFYSTTDGTVYQLQL